MFFSNPSLFESVALFALRPSCFNCGTRVNLNWTLVWIKLNFGVVRRNIGPIRFEHWSKRFLFHKSRSLRCFEHDWKLTPSKTNTLQKSSGFVYAFSGPIYFERWTGPIEMNWTLNWGIEFWTISGWTLNFANNGMNFYGGTNGTANMFTTRSPKTTMHFRCTWRKRQSSSHILTAVILILCLSRHLITFLYSYMYIRSCSFSTFCWFVFFPS